MPQKSDVPFNVSILELTEKKLVGVKPVTKQDIFDGATHNFDEGGLFSVSIFGKVGDERRSQRFSFVDIKAPVFHPVIYRALAQLKRLYAAIMAGTEYAVWNPETKDFERSNSITGRTGYAFFLEYWKLIEFGDTKSVTREMNVSLLKKFQSVALTSKVIVMPAGMRDVELDGGRVQMDEINTFYRKLLAISNTISEASVKTAPEVINTARYNLQLTFNQLYDMLENMVQGKKKLLMGKWASRRIQDGTRNVITAMDTSSPYLGAPDAVGFNNTVIGLYQMLKAARPIAMYNIRNGFLSKVFFEVGRPVKLIDKKTLRPVEVTLKTQSYDRWMTNEGIEKVITSFGDEDLRHKPLEIEGYYLGLMYKGPDGTYKIFQDIGDVPIDRSRKDVAPLTFCELLYLSTFQAINGLPLFVTRYPVTGVGSIYPSLAYVKTTIKAEVRKELDEQWHLRLDAPVAYQFPIAGGAFINSLVPHSAKLGKLGADFDGDTASGNVTYSDESIAEVKAHLSKKRAYVGTDGSFMSSIEVSTVSLVFHNLTGYDS
jgi:hypothetical protein